MGQFEKFSQEEVELIRHEADDQPFRVLLTDSPLDLKKLRSDCKNVDPTDVNLPALASRMYATVVDEASAGVGIAAPQIGINKNLFWVQRFDKVDHPFEFFINPQIVWYSDVKRLGREGCLSVPVLYGEVQRSLVIRIVYQDIQGRFKDEVVEGFTAVIFQHEFDHLRGTLFLDRLELQQTQEFYPAQEENNLFYLKKS